MMVVEARIERTAVAARTESGWSCTVTVERDPLGQDLLRYQGGETTAVELTPEVIELLTTALSVRGQSAIAARTPNGDASTLVVIGYQDGWTRLYFDAHIAASAVLDTTARDTLRAALKPMSSG